MNNGELSLDDVLLQHENLVRKAREELTAIEARAFRIRSFLASLSAPVPSAPTAPPAVLPTQAVQAPSRNLATAPKEARKHMGPIVLKTRSGGLYEILVACSNGPASADQVTQRAYKGTATGAQTAGNRAQLGRLTQAGYLVLEGNLYRLTDKGTDFLTAPTVVPPMPEKANGHTVASQSAGSPSVKILRALCDGVPMKTADGIARILHGQTIVAAEVTAIRAACMTMVHSGHVGKESPIDTTVEPQFWITNKGREFLTDIDKRLSTHNDRTAHTTANGAK